MYVTIAYERKLKDSKLKDDKNIISKKNLYKKSLEFEYITKPVYSSVIQSYD